jgi:hypothetical protein
MLYFIFIESNKLIISSNSNFKAYAQQEQTVFCSTNTTIANHHKHRRVSRNKGMQLRVVHPPSVAQGAFGFYDCF